MRQSAALDDDVGIGLRGQCSRSQPAEQPARRSEITKKLDPLKFNLRTMPERLAKVGDLFADVFKNKAKLPAIG